MAEVELGIGSGWSNNVFVLIAVLAVGAAVLAGVVRIFSRMRKIRKECRETLSQRYDTKDIVCHDNLAHYLGMESFTGKQVRGKGILVLAKNELFFLRLHPRMELSIPLKRIKRIVTPTAFLDISAPAPLLKIDFQDEDSAINSVAWQVGDVTSFATSLKLQRKEVQQRKRKESGRKG